MAGLPVNTPQGRFSGVGVTVPEGVSGGGPLGTYAESSPSLILKGFSSALSPAGEATAPSSFSGLRDAVLQRFLLQNMARRAMFREFYRQHPEKVDRQGKRPHRVCECRRSLRPVPGGEGKLYKPSVFRHNATGATFYAGHQICGSARACPLCAIKIGQTRADEIRRAVSQWIHDGGICLFVTLTFPHYWKDSLGTLVESFQGAMKRFRKGANFDRIKAGLGYAGIIRAIETTWGEKNGHHPHAHEIWFCRPGDDLHRALMEAARESRRHWVATRRELVTGELLALKVRLYDKWRAAVVASGLSAPSFEHGVSVQVAETEEECRDRLAEYMAKTGLELDPKEPVWGVDDEMVRVHTKRGKPGRFTPFDFLREQYNPETDKATKERYLALFAEFVREFHGTAQVYWSPGLRARFDVREVSDQQAAEPGDEPSSRLLELEGHIWAFVEGVKPSGDDPLREYRAELLNEARKDGLPGATAFLHALLDRHFLDHFQDDYARLSHQARYLLSLRDSDFVTLSFGDTS